MSSSNSTNLLHHDLSILYRGGIVTGFNPGLFHAKKNILLILNNPTNITIQQCQHLWNQSKFAICADGAGAWLYEENLKNKELRLIPRLIHGDLDSFRKAQNEEAYKFFMEHNCEITRNPSQDSTDMEKCLNESIRFIREDEEKNIQQPPPPPLRNRGEEEVEEPNKHYNVFVLGAFGGRFDHEMGNLNTGLRFINRFNRILFLSSNCFGEILTPNTKHVLSPIPKDTLCGIIPIFGPCDSLTTQGLKWNLTKHPSHFGGMVSTSNQTVEEKIQIEISNQPMFWTSVIT